MTILLLGLSGVTPPALGQGLQVLDVAPFRAPESASTEAVVTGAGLVPGTQITLIGSAAFFTGKNPAGPFAPGESPLVVRDDLAYVSTLDLKIFDLSDPDSPQLIGQLDQFGYALALAGDVLYLAQGATVTRVDVSDPASPSVIGSATAPISCASTDADTLGQVLYVACGRSRPYILVWENGAYVRRVTTGAPTTINQANDVAVANGHAYVTDRERGLTILDLTDPTSPVPVGQLPPGAVDGRALTVDGDIVWLGGLLEVVAVDVSDPTAPFIRGRARHYLWPVGMTHADGVLYSTGIRSGPQLYDVRDPDHPLVLYPMSPDAYSIGYGLEATGDNVYAVRFDFGDLVTFDTREPSPPGLGAGLSSIAGFEWLDPAGSPGRLHVREGNDLVLLDISPGGPFVRRGSVNLGAPGQVVNQGDLDYVAGDLGLQVVDVGDPDLPIIVGQLALPPLHDLSVLDQTLFAVTSDGIRIVDVSDPTSPAEIGALDLDAGEVVAGSGLLVVEVDSERTEIFTLADPAHPQLAATIPVSPWALELAGTTLVVGTGDGGLTLFDLSDPASPTPLGGIGAPLQVFGIALQGTLARVRGRLGDSNATRGQFLVDISDPMQPRLVGGTAQLTTAGFADQGWNYGFTGPNGLRSWRLNPATTVDELAGAEARLSVPAGLSPGYYDVVAVSPDGEYSILRRGFEVQADSDGDGAPDEDDCEPENPEVYPGAIDLPGNEVDEDCDGEPSCDSDAPWLNRGAYVSCVSEACDSLVEAGLLEGRDCARLVRDAAHSGS